jgi:small subunit ribosomal protein S20
VANIKSAEKRIRQAEKRRLRNRVIIGSMRTAIRKARAAIDGNAKEAQELIRQAVSSVDRAVSKGALKRQTGSRYISRLTSRKSA